VFDVHWWIFSIKYFEKGLEVTRFKSNDMLTKGIRVILAICFLVYLAQQTYLPLTLYKSHPVFQPVDAVTLEECQQQLIVYIEEYSAWDEAHYQTFESLYIGQIIYYACCFLLTLAGVAMIHRYCKRLIVKIQLMRMNWY
jgi:hypothetical protein